MGTVTINGIEYITDEGATAGFTEKQHGFYAKDFKVRTARDVLRDMGVKDRAGRDVDDADFDYERDKIAEKILGPMPNYDLDKPFPGKGKFDESRGYNPRGSDVNNYSYYDNNRKKVIKLVESKEDQDIRGRQVDESDPIGYSSSIADKTETSVTEPSAEAVATDEVVTDKEIQEAEVVERNQEWEEYFAAVDEYWKNEDREPLTDSNRGDAQDKAVPVPPNETDEEMITRLKRYWKTGTDRYLGGTYGVWEKIEAGTATVDDFNNLLDFGGRQWKTGARNILFSTSDIRRLESMRDSLIKREETPKSDQGKERQNTHASRNALRAEGMFDKVVGMLLS